MLCTKSPNKFKYADNFDDEFAEVDPGIFSKGEDFSWPRKRSPFAEDGDAIPEACAVTSATESTIECECPCELSSPPRTRNDFSITKNAANPTKIPNLCADQSLDLVFKKGIAGKTIPYQYIPFFFDHYKMDARALMFAHERVWDKVEKDIWEETSSLKISLIKPSRAEDERCLPRRRSWYSGCYHWSPQG